MNDITKNRRARWALVALAVILVSIGLYLCSISPKIGKPVETKVEKKGRTTVTTRYWDTEEKRELAEKNQDFGEWQMLCFFGAAFSMYYGIKGLIQIKQKSPESAEYNKIF